MNHIPLYAECTGYVCWTAILWALMTKVALTAERVIRERRRRRNARRLATWKPPPPRHTHDPGHDVTRVLPGIQRPKGP
jgi:hypothetical protein